MSAIVTGPSNPTPPPNSPSPRPSPSPSPSPSPTPSPSPKPSPITSAVGINMYQSVLLLSKSVIQSESV